MKRKSKVNYESIINDFLDGEKNFKGTSHYTERLFIDNGIIFSYGYHYPLGKFKAVNDKRILLINNSGYSNTTTKHIRLLKSIADSRGVLNVFCNNDFNISLALSENKNTIKELKEKVIRAYKQHRKEQHKENISDLERQNKTLIKIIPYETAEVI